MKTVSLKLPDALDVKLSVFIRKRKVSKSVVIRDALEAYLAREDEADPNSFLESARRILFWNPLAICAAAWMARQIYPQIQNISTVFAAARSAHAGAAAR